jgi:hypothetical protein
VELYLQGNRRTRRQTCPSDTLSTTKPTWSDPSANSGLRGESPATNRLSHGTAPYCGVSNGNLLKLTMCWIKSVLKLTNNVLTAKSVLWRNTAIIRWLLNTHYSLAVHDFIIISSGSLTKIWIAIVARGNRNVGPRLDQRTRGRNIWRVGTKSGVPGFDARKLNFHYLFL